MSAGPTLLHASALALALDADGPLAGLLLLGAPGAGKSAAALDAIETCPWRRSALVADDAVLLSAAQGGVFASVPQTIAGLAELRGFGPVRVRTAPGILLAAGFDFDLRGERAPEPQIRRLAPGLSLPIWPAPMGGGWRLRLALRAIVGGQTL